MKKILVLSVAVAIIFVMFFSIQTVSAADPLDLTGVDNFAILANTYSNPGSGTILNGDLGYTVAPANPPIVNGAIYASPDPVYVAAQAARADLVVEANAEPCDFDMPGAVDLTSLPQPMPSGVYCIGGAASISNAITLNGDGVYIFRIDGALNALENSLIVLDGNAKADNIFWVPTGATTLEDDSIFTGIILPALPAASVTLGSFVVMDGRILSNGPVTTSGLLDTITAPLVTIAPPSTSLPATGQHQRCISCVPPTLGVDSNGIRMVGKGFSYNGNSSNVNLFFTPLKLITTKVGVVNKAVFKIYEDEGPGEIRHFDFIFGLAKGQILGDSKALIEWSQSWDGIKTFKVIDPEHALKDVRVEASEGQCKTGVIKNDCLIVTIYHTFVTPLEFNIIATNVWDDHRNTWQNYFTPGVKVMDKSINEPKLDPGIPFGATVLISDLNITKSKVMVGETVQLTFRITDGTGNVVPWVTPDVGICKESAAKPQYALVTPKSVLSQDSDCPFFQSDFITSSDRFKINLVIPEGIPEGKYTLDVWADPDYTVARNFIGAHKSVDITVDDKIKSPLKQFKAGIDAGDVGCKEGLQLVVKSSNNSPACVKPETKEKLIERGWAKPQS